MDNGNSMDKVIAQIKKVLRLARGTTEAGERAAAEATAKRLAERHGIRLETLDETEEVTNVMEKDGQLHRFYVEDGMACAVLRRHFSVVCMVEQFGRRVRYVWFGNPLNIDVARHVQHIVTREARRAWNEYRARAPKAERAAFMTGWFAAIDRTLTLNPLRNDIDQARSEARQAERAYLGWKENLKRETGEEVGEKEIKGGKRGHENDALHGLRAGMAVNLSRPVAGNQERRQELARPVPQLGMM